MRLYENVLGPLLARIGTAGAAYLVGFGINAEHANNIMVGATAVVLVAIDLGVGYYNRQKAKGVR